MSEAPAPGTSSTPPGSPPPSADPAAAPPPSSSAPPAEPPKGGSSPQAGDPAQPPPGKAEAGKGDTPPPAEPPKEPPKDQPLFVVPEDFKAPEAMLAKFTEFAKANPAQAQATLDLYVGFAREANTAWQKQVEATNAANEARCKEVFTAEELAAAETAVGYFTSHNPTFRDFAKRQLNDPHFTLVMRYVGELLAEDTIGRDPRPPTPTIDKRPLRIRAAEKLYPNMAKPS